MTWPTNPEGGPTTSFGARKLGEKNSHGKLSKHLSNGWLIY